MAAPCRLAVVSEAGGLLIEIRMLATPQNQDLGPEEERALLPSSHLHCHCTVYNEPNRQTFSAPKGKLVWGAQALSEATKAGHPFRNCLEGLEFSNFKEKKCTYFTQRPSWVPEIPKISLIWLSL